MTDAKRDNNQTPVITATSNADGSTPVPVKVNESSHAVSAVDNTTGSDLSGDTASRDSNAVPVMMGVSDVDGITPTSVYADPATGEILIKST